MEGDRGVSFDTTEEAQLISWPIVERCDDSNYAVRGTRFQSLKALCSLRRNVPTITLQHIYRGEICIVSLCKSSLANFNPNAILFQVIVFSSIHFIGWMCSIRSHYINKNTNTPRHSLLFTLPPCHPKKEEDRSHPAAKSRTTRCENSVIIQNQ